MREFQSRSLPDIRCRSIRLSTVGCWLLAGWHGWLASPLAQLCAGLACLAGPKSVVEVEAQRVNLQSHRKYGVPRPCHTRRLAFPSSCLPAHGASPNPPYIHFVTRTCRHSPGGATRRRTHTTVPRHILVPTKHVCMYILRTVVRRICRYSVLR